MLKNKDFKIILNNLKNKNIIDISFKNEYNFTSYQLRIDPEQKTISRGAWTWGDVVIYSKKELYLIIEMLFLMGFNYV